MKNLRIIYDNATDRAMLTASSQAGTLGPANLQREGKSLVLRSIGAALSITATWPAPEIVGGVALPFCNLTPAAAIRVRGYIEPGDAVPAFDSGVMPAGVYARLGMWDWGALPLGLNAYSSGSGTYARCWFQMRSIRKLVIDLADPDNPAGYIEAARLVAGPYWSAEQNASNGAGITPFDTAQLSVHSYASEAAYLAGSGLAWNTPLQMPLLQLQGELGDIAERWLATDPASPFAGGSIAADRSGTLDIARSRAWARIKQARALAETVDFAWDGALYQADKDRITGATQQALLAQAAGQPYSIDWTLSDNTQVTLDAAGMVAVGAALGAHIAGVFAIGRDLRARIAVATSAEALDAIVWPVPEGV